MLFSTETGEPLAIFPDGYVQKLRVAGAGAIAARYLARKDSKVMALLGSGWQASAHLVTLCMVRDLKKVKVYTPTPETRRRFVKEMGGAVSAEVAEAGSVEEAIEGADIITAATNSISALFPGELLQPGVHVSCVKPCELDAITYKRSDPLIIHWHEAKPFQIAIGVDRQSIPDVSDGWQHPITREDAAVWNFPTLSQLVNGQHPGRVKDDAITCFCNNVGLGLQFAAVGSEVLARRSEEHTSELQSQSNLVCRLLLETKNQAQSARGPRSPRNHAERDRRFDHRPDRCGSATAAVRPARTAPRGPGFCWPRKPITCPKT